MARILIVDDHDVMRHQVRHILETQDDWEVAGEATNGQEALKLISEVKPDAVVMDISMPVMNGLQATKEITRRKLDCKVLILTMHDNPIFLRPIQRSGAKGLVTKSRAASELTPALQAIVVGHSYFH